MIITGLLRLKIGGSASVLCHFRLWKLWRRTGTVIQRRYEHLINLCQTQGAIILSYFNAFKYSFRTGIINIFLTVVINI